MGSIRQKDLFRLKLYKKRQKEKLSKLKINEKEFMESSEENLRKIIMSTGMWEVLLLSSTIALLGDHTLHVLKKLSLQLVSLRNVIISNGEALRKDYM